MRLYFMSPRQDWELDAFNIKLRETIDIFADLPALQNLYVVCAITAWIEKKGIFRALVGWKMENTPKKIFSAVELKVSEKLNEVLKGRAVDVTVTAFGGAPRMN
jgi:hypothetical protein